MYQVFVQYEKMYYLCGTKVSSPYDDGERSKRQDAGHP